MEGRSARVGHRGEGGRAVQQGRSGRPARCNATTLPTTRSVSTYSPPGTHPASASRHMWTVESAEWFLLSPITKT